MPGWISSILRRSHLWISWGPDKPPEALEEVEISSLQEAQAHHPEPPGETDSPPQQEPPTTALSPQTPEKVEYFSPQQRPSLSIQAAPKIQKHLHFSRRLHLNQDLPPKLKVLLTATKPQEYLQCLWGIETAFDQQKSPPEPSDILEEVKPPLVQQEAPVQPT